MIIVAIDEISFIKSSEILNNLDPRKCMVKIGSVSFNSIGPVSYTHLTLPTKA